MNDFLKGYYIVRHLGLNFILIRVFLLAQKRIGTTKKKFNYGEMRLSNGEMQSGMMRKLNKSKIKGYQVTGRALKKFETELNSHIPTRFALEAISPKIILVRWKQQTTKSQGNKIEAIA